MGKNQTSFKKGHIPFKKKNVISNSIVCYCDYCGKEFKRKPSQYFLHKNHFCSRECGFLYVRFLMSEEEKNNLYANRKPKMSPKDRKIRLKARHDVNHAVEKGILKREPCIICGCNKTQAHHADYDKPLDIIWLCYLHHKELHQNKIYVR